ncbi:MAG TPA: hypothetical protein VJT73_08275 [Polyangiaceae bacterium]|nr:hypothetical protein [Polyangiaceae bacterium]
MQERRPKSGPALRLALLAIGLSSFTTRDVRAEQPPAFPVQEPYDIPIPTPAAPFPYYLPPPDGQSPPPFDSPLPPAVPFAPPITILPATPEPPAPPPPYVLPERPDQAEPPQGGLRQSLSEYDRRLGLGGGGAVVSAVRNLAMTERARGSATFEVVVDRTGKVRTVRLLDASRDAPEWREFGIALSAEPIPNVRIPETARAAWVLVHVDANDELTSGQRRWWSYGVWLTFDVADVSAHRERVVHSRVLSEVWF